MSAEDATKAGNQFGWAPMWLNLWNILAKVDRKRLKWATAATLVGSFMSAGIPLIVGAIVDAVFKDGHLVSLAHALLPLGGLVAAYVISCAMDLIRHQQVHAVTTGFQSDSRQKIYSRVLRWDLREFRDGTDGAIYGRANRSVEGAEKLIKLGASDLVPAFLLAFFAVVLAIIEYHLIGLVMALVVPTGTYLVMHQIKSQSGIRLKVSAAKERIDGSVVSWLQMIKVIRTTGTEDYFDTRVYKDCEKLRKTEFKHHIAMSVYDLIKSVNEVIWLVITLVVTIKFKLAASAGDFAGMVLIYFAMTKPLRELHRVFDESSEAAGQTRNLLEDLAKPSDNSFAPIANGANDAGPSFGAVRFEDVHFRYPGARKDTLTGVSVTIPVGQRVGIVGTSGGGKSTLLDVLARLHHGHRGQVLVNGRRIESIQRSEIVDLIGYVGQEPTLFPGTIRDNLTLGRTGLSEEDLDEACRRANILADMKELEKGYDTQVSQRGGNLSGGQRQRLCIARALLRTPPIMLLDEPTSALDGPSQAVVQQAIDELDDVTMLVVAHRLSTLQTMDRILVLDGGKIVEDGTYQSLASADGRFSAMLNSEKRSAA